METRQDPVAAAGFILLASALIAGTTLLAKLAGQDHLGDPLHPLQISHGRFLFAFIAISLMAGVLRPRFSRPALGLHVARSASGWAGISLMFAAVTFIPLADATAISFLNPIIAMVLAIPLLGERVGPWRWGAAAIALVGAFVLIQPGTGSFHPAALLALAAAFIMGFEITLIKRLTGREAPLQILWFNNAIGCTIATIAVLFVWQTPSAGQWIALACLGTMMATAQACFIQGMKRADASFVAPFQYATLIFAGLYDFVGFSAIPAATSILGAGIIIAGGVILAWRETRATRRPIQAR
ncbi:DMT family transporter [Aliiroseovarius sp. KMU-50]|uniref:DMT family transporter n=1 Tax=Aliiroseovarius salicola TaxID=3009082 RepID=A0ABT4VW88_9RHOB|nr:DMT family transporter [Aliiroseovarius sp. KMU-50]MDA5092510.1 DMT family transporter [Aliiroseovarius sp. KMU-50]